MTVYRSLGVRGECRLLPCVLQGSFGFVAFDCWHWGTNGIPYVGRKAATAPGTEPCICLVDATGRCVSTG
jgi:hypothetical protein